MKTLFSPPLALVTGAAHRLGFLFACTLAEQGYAILLHYHYSRDDAESAAQKLRLLDVPVYLAQADLSDADSAISLFGVVDSLSHPLRVLVNSAEPCNEPICAPCPSTRGKRR